MKNNLFLFVFVSFTSILLGQIHEVGFSLGGSNYIGDIGRGNYINPNKVAAGLFYKYNKNPRIVLRTAYSFIPIQGDDQNASSTFRKDR